MAFIKLFMFLGLILALVDTSFAGFMPQAFTGTFLQIQKTSSPFKKDHKVETSISYQYPKQFRMKIKNKKQDTLFICNKSNTWFYSAPLIEGEKGQLRRSKSSKFCYVKLFDALSRGLTSNKIYTVTKKSAKEFSLSFSKAATEELSFEKVNITFDDLPAKFQNVESLALYKVGAKAPIIFKRKAIKVVESLDKKLFTFKIPKNTEIIEMK